MKPIKLIMSAFGPYAGKPVEIPFEVFEEKGLFLIAGDTGAGKTMIFDAISYALFGCASGSRRNSKNFRSEYAREDEKSYVEFEFSHQGKNYKIKRNPPYLRPKKNREGYTEEKENACLYCQGEPVADGISNVNQAVEDLLHITASQFKQIVMIAQGEFLDMLNAETKVRTEILRNIFMTGAYKNIEYKLKDRMNEKEALRGKCQQSMIQYLMDVKLPEEGPAAESLGELREKIHESKALMKLDELLGLLQQLIQEDSLLLKELGEKQQKESYLLEAKRKASFEAKKDNALLDKLEGLKAKKQELKDREGEIEDRKRELGQKKAASHRVKPVYERWKNTEGKMYSAGKNYSKAQRGLKEAEDLHLSCEERLTRALSHEEELGQLRTRVAQLKREEESYKKRDDIRGRILDLQGQKKELAAEKERLDRQEEELGRRTASLSERVTALEGMPEEKVTLANLGGRLADLDRRLADLVQKDVPQLMEQKKDCRRKQEIFLKAQRDYMEARERRNKAEDSLDRYRAGILASDLEEGTPCPVCGSVHHPNLARLPEEFITQDQLDELSDKEEKAARKKEKANSDAEKARGGLETAEDNLRITILDQLESDLLAEARNENWGGAGPVPTSITLAGWSVEDFLPLIHYSQEKLGLQIKENADALKKAASGVRELNRAKKDLEKARGPEREELTARGKRLQEASTQNTAALAQNEGLLKSYSNLPFETLAQAQTERKGLEEKAQAFSEEIRLSREGKEKAGQQLSSARTNLKNRERELEELRKEEAVEKAGFSQALVDNHFSGEDVFRAYLVEDREIKQDKAVINKYEKDLNAIEVQLADVEKEAEGKKYVDLSVLEEEEQRQKVVVDGLRDQMGQVDFRHKTNEEKYQSIGSERENFEKLEKECSICKRLYALVTGQTGKKRITLEQYVQAAGFDRIIQAANRRLNPMSEGQYELYRQEDAPGRRSNTFLDLEVLDNFTGHRRPVANLSGGESFKAALSLALGLSDTVSSNLGGVQMDALFIDEGFGTLGRKSIQNAMDILVNLSGKNKLVGIISHREELLDNIQQQIRVSKDKNGSHIQIDSFA